MTNPVGPELLVRLLDEFGGTLALYARRWTNQAEDCVQDALVELARQEQAPDNPVAWLFRVVRNRALSAVRQTKRRERREIAAAEMYVARAGNDASMLAGEVVEAIERLPDDQREAVIARTWGGLGFEEIGTLLGVSTATAHRKYEAALATLRERMGVTCPKTKN